MKAAWIRLAHRIDALTLRERAIMAVSLAAALAAVADALVLSPQFAAQRSMVQQLRTQGEALGAMRTQLSAPAADDVGGRLRRSLAERGAELARVDARIDQRLAAGTAAPLPALLQRVLRRHERLNLLALDTTRPDPADPMGRRLVKLSLAGRYAELTAFVEATERELPALRWTELVIDGSTQPPVLGASLWLPGEGS